MGFGAGLGLQRFKGVRPWPGSVRGSLWRYQMAVGKQGTYMGIAGACRIGQAFSNAITHSSLQFKVVGYSMEAQEVQHLPGSSAKA